MIPFRVVEDRRPTRLKLFAGTTPTRLRTGEGELARMIDQRSQLKGAINPLVAET